MSEGCLSGQDTTWELRVEIQCQFDPLLHISHLSALSSRPNTRWLTPTARARTARTNRRKPSAPRRAAPSTRARRSERRLAIKAAASRSTLRPNAKRASIRRRRAARRPARATSRRRDVWRHGCVGTCDVTGRVTSRDVIALELATTELYHRDADDS